MSHIHHIFVYIYRSAAATALFASLLTAEVHAQNVELAASTKQLETELQAIAIGKRGQWVELPTGGWSTRHFIAEIHRREADNTVLAQLRVDHIAATAESTASVVQTKWLYCDAGQKRTVAARGYDLLGRQTFFTDTPDAKTMPMERLYSGPEQLICSQQYLLLEVVDGYQRLSDLLLLRRSMRASSIPDRPIPSP